MDGMHRTELLLQSNRRNCDVFASVDNKLTRDETMHTVSSALQFPGCLFHCTCVCVCV